MDDRPIGVFDSGLGGLTAIKKLAVVLPNEEIIYLGDTGRVPYGSRSRETIVKYAFEDMAFLSTFDIKAMVVACNTVSSAALGELSRASKFPIFGVVDAPAARAAQVTRNKRIGVIGTEATIRSGAYEKRLREYMPEAEVFSTACPLFVPLVENGRTSRDDIVVTTIASEYLAPLKEQGIDTLVLGCTHYPLLMDVLSDTMGPGVQLIDSGAETSVAVAGVLEKEEMLTGRTDAGKRRYFVTDRIEGFSQLASLFLGDDIKGSVTQVSLD